MKNSRHAVIYLLLRPGKTPRPGRIFFLSFRIYDKVPFLLHVSWTERCTVFVLLPLIYLAVAVAIAVAPDLLADLPLKLQYLPGQVVEMLEDMHLEEEPLYEKVPVTDILH